MFIFYDSKLLLLPSGNSLKPLCSNSASNGGFPKYFYNKKKAFSFENLSF